MLFGSWAATLKFKPHVQKISDRISADIEKKYWISDQHEKAVPVDLYFSPLQDVKSHGLERMMYADDSQLYIIMNPLDRHTSMSMISLEQCINDIQTIFLINKLPCNPSKTEVIHFSSRFSRYTPVPGVRLDQYTIEPVSEVRNLGVIQDSHRNMSSNINSICRSTSLALRNIGRVRKYLSQTNTERLVHALIKSKLDYCNSLLYWLPSTEIQKLQRIQNLAARLVVKAKRREHISPILYNLHRLPVNY